MFKKRYSAFYNYFGKLREPPLEGLFGENKIGGVHMDWLNNIIFEALCQ